MATTNIFRIASYTIGAEDRFTAFLHYLIQNIPSIGQEMVDFICEKSGVNSGKFKTSIDHPEGNAENRPDFMLSCDEFDILCEHKVESELGARQLERYLALPTSRETRLVLISNRHHVIPDEVTKSANYLRPPEVGLSLFFWEDFFPLIANHEERLAQEFADYMRDLGMAPCPHPEQWKQLFHNREVAEHFYESTRELRTYFTDMGAHCQVGSTRLGFQIKKPNDRIHLIYFYATKSIAPPSIVIDAPYLIASVYVLDEPVRDTTMPGEIVLETEEGKIVVRTIFDQPKWNKDLIQTHECIGSLSDFLATNTAATRQKLLAFGRHIFVHAAQQL